MHLAVASARLVAPPYRPAVGAEKLAMQLASSVSLFFDCHLAMKLLSDTPTGDSATLPEPQPTMD